MPNIARTTPRPAPRPSVPAAKTKILLVRQPVKSVRPSDEPNRTALHLAYGIVSAIGAVGAVWLLGYLGYRLGFAPLVRVPDLSMEATGGLAAGVLMFLSMPQTIIEAGMVEPLWLMLGFAMIALPAAILGAVKPAAPGGPRPKPEVVALSIMGAIAAALNAGLVVWWAASPMRNSLLGELPLAAVAVDAWMTQLRLAGGLDVLATLAAALWVVVIMRLAIPKWLRVLAACVCYFALATVAVAMAMSNVAISQAAAPRSVAFYEDGPPTAQLVLGHTHHGLAAMHVQHNDVMVDVRAKPVDLNIIGRESIIRFIEASAPEPE